MMMKQFGDKHYKFIVIIPGTHVVECSLCRQHQYNNLSSQLANGRSLRLSFLGNTLRPQRNVINTAAGRSNCASGFCLLTTKRYNVLDM